MPKEEGFLLDHNEDGNADEREDDGGSCSRYNCQVMIISIILGVVAVVTGFAFMQWEKIIHYVYPTSYLFTVGVCASLLIAGVCGLCFACARIGMLRIGYLFCAVLYIGFMIGCVWVTAVIAMGGLKKDMSHNWVDAAAKNTEKICEFQLDHNCTGWYTPCQYAQNTVWDPSCPNCTKGDLPALILANSTTCYDVLHDRIKKVLPYMFCGAVLCLAAVITGGIAITKIRAQ